MSALGNEFRKLMAAKLDISEHLGLLRGLASSEHVRTIVEFGFRTGVSATALLTSGKTVWAYDPDPKCSNHVSRIRRMLPMANRLMWHQKSSLEAKIPECELLHIDSLHTYKQLSAELERHHHRVRTWIAMHDTETFADKGKDGTKPGLMRAVEEFLARQEEWRLLLHLPNNNGMTVLERSTPR